MKKKLILITVFAFVGCGSFKKNVDKQSKESETTEQTYSKKETETTTETTESGSKETKIDYKANTFTFTPFDAVTPYFVDGKEYKGGTLVIKDENSSTQSNEVYENIINEYKKELESLRQLYENSQKETDKKVDTEFSNTWLMLGIAFLFFVLLLFVIFYFNNRIKSITNQIKI